ncbi:MAG: acyl-CoA thioester hydrolase [Actinomycetota bacterium]|jgi:acyl-CoA thioester hydrolase|nr:acyl-CoA thioester hydrolase [Actinomycetota bacterium]MDQ1542274.1 acyl-CoA thioester hydrolase [Actinomycetota bacterium]MDX6418854.1 acyl-CoA thioester hydrolase [Trebonia sp.]
MTRAGETLRRDDFAVLRPLQTRWADMDTYSHVNNAVHYELMDTAVNGWLVEATGTDIRGLAAVGWVVETSCRYLAPLQFPTVVDVGIALERLGRTSVAYRLALFGDDLGPVAVARFVHVYVDRNDHKPAPVPEVVRRALETLGHDPAKND